MSAGRRPVAIGLALMVAAIVFELVVIAWGESPRALAAKLWAGTWGSSFGVGQVVFKATTIALAGLAARIALSAGLFHIGIDGCIALASLAVGASLARFSPGVSPLVAWPIGLLIAALIGAAWALPAAALRVRFGAHEVISGIMTNNIGASLVSLLLAKGLAEHASVHTRALPSGARLPRLSALPGLSALHGSAASIACALAVIAVVGGSWISRRTVLGRDLAAIAGNPSAARASGIAVGRLTLGAMLLSGAVAGLASLNEVMGYRGWAEEGGAAGAGFVGLAAALLGGESSIGLLFASLLFATLSQGGLAINATLPMEIVDVLSAVVTLLVAIAPKFVEKRWPPCAAEAST